MAANNSYENGVAYFRSACSYFPTKSKSTILCAIRRRHSTRSGVECFFCRNLALTNVTKLDFPRFDRHEIDAAIIESAAKREDPYRIVILGPEKVGKTALICRFIEKDFPIKHRATSEQTNFCCYSLSGVKVKLEILDTSGKNEVSIELIIIIDFNLSQSR